MKKLVKWIYKVIIRLLFHRYIYVSNKTCLGRLNIKNIDKDNFIELKGCDVGCLRLDISGHKNKIFFQGKELKNVSICIVGKGNQLFIDEGVRIFNSEFIIRGSNCKINIGRNTTIAGAYFVNMGDGNMIKVGEECMFSDQIEIWATDSHPIFDINYKVTNPSQSISIGNHVWLGKRSSILKGVNIGDNCIVGMGALVTKSFSKNTICAGNPAKAIKEVFCWKREFIKV